MIINPVYKKEVRQTNRGVRPVLFVLGFNGILSLVAFSQMVLAVEQARVRLVVDYEQFLSLFRLIVLIECSLLVFFMPAVTAGLISSEREQKTMDILMTLPIRPVSIIAGKLAAAMSFMLFLFISSAPVISMLFVYVGITPGELLLLIFSVLTAGFLTGSIGIYASSICKKTTTATVLSYGILFVMVIGTVGLHQIFSYTLGDILYGQSGMFLEGLERPDTGFIKYLLLFNPMVSSTVMVHGISGNHHILSDVFGIGFEREWIGRDWIFYSLLLQNLFAALMVSLSVKAITPIWSKYIGAQKNSTKGKQNSNS